MADVRNQATVPLVEFMYLQPQPRITEPNNKVVLFVRVSLHNQHTIDEGDSPIFSGFGVDIPSKFDFLF